jgi:N6-L-threonylcarbamoyladenine synthase
MILAIESSCDETSVAVVNNSNVLSNVISSQYFHSKFGGVIPELASRAHLKACSAITKESLDFAGVKMSDIKAIAVTHKPGLAGSLIVGSSFAKGLALMNNLPIIPVNHIEGHLFSGCLQDSTLEFPFISMVVSGGHTAIFLVQSYDEYKMIGSTKDDAAGEAFDKIAKLMGIPYPGGPLIDKYAKDGDSQKYDFPRPMIHESNFDFSFSGLKTSVRYYIHKNFPEGIPDSEINNLCASVQQAIVDVLVKKVINAAKYFKIKSIVIAGGVSANSQLRNDLSSKAGKLGIKAIAPEMTYCVDNAAMIGFIGEMKFKSNPELYNSLTFTVNSTALRAS